MTSATGPDWTALGIGLLVTVALPVGLASASTLRPATIHPASITLEGNTAGTATVTTPTGWQLKPLLSSDRATYTRDDGATVVVQLTDGAPDFGLVARRRMRAIDTPTTTPQLLGQPSTTPGDVTWQACRITSTTQPPASCAVVQAHRPDGGEDAYLVATITASIDVDGLHNLVELHP